MTFRNALMLALALTATGCVFEPECSTYEQCVVERRTDDTTTNAATSSNNATTSSNNVTTEPSNNSANGDPVLACSATECPDADVYTLGGDEFTPLGCASFGELEFFELEEATSVCAGKPRSYEVYIASCESTYIVEVTLETPSMCADSAILDFEFDGHACGMQNTRCSQTDTVIERAVIIQPRDFSNSQLLKITVDAQVGGFDYVLRVRSRR